MKSLKVISVLTAGLLALPLCACSKKKGGGSSGDEVVPPDPVPPVTECTHESVTESVTAATCTQDGLKTFVCNDCSVTVRTEVIEALGHDYSHAQENGKCGRDGCEQKISSLNLSYTLSDDGTYYTVSNANRSDDCKDLVIPEYYNNIPVRKIADEAFAGNSAIESVSIPKTITSIGAGAFNGCNISSLYYNAEECEDFNGRNWVFYPASNQSGMAVIIGKSVKRIPKQLFYPLITDPSVIPQITSVTFEDGSSLEEIGSYAFYKTIATTITFPDTVKTIGDYAFFASGLKTVSFSNSLEQIGNSSFNYCVNIETVDLSGTKLVNLQDSVFRNCSGIKTLSLPSTLEEIENKAFYGCTGITKIDTVNVTTVGESAFENCSSVSELVLGEQLKSVGKSVFKNCNAVANIMVKSISLDDFVASNCVFENAGLKNGVFVTFENAAMRIPARMFFSSANTESNIKIATLTIGSGVTEIGDYAFNGVTVDTLVNNSNASVGKGNDALTQSEGE